MESGRPVVRHSPLATCHRSWGPIAVQPLKRLLEIVDLDGLLRTVHVPGIGFLTAGPFTCAGV